MADAIKADKAAEVLLSAMRGDATVNDTDLLEALETALPSADLLLPAIAPQINADSVREALPSVLAQLALPDRQDLALPSLRRSARDLRLTSVLEALGAVSDNGLVWLTQAQRAGVNTTYQQIAAVSTNIVLLYANRETFANYLAAQGNSQ